MTEDELIRYHDLFEHLVANGPASWGAYGFGQALRAGQELQAEVRRLRAALQEISIGRGPYSRDPLTHADNTIDAMKAVALGALDGTWKADSD